MNIIFFEKQISRLCAQHALNMLLQKHAFSLEDLAFIAQLLDSREHAIGVPSTEPSQNYDDTGYFSIEVIQVALQQHKLESQLLTNPNYSAYRENPDLAQAFICNLREHWFTLRKFNEQWFILNSVLNGPLRITTDYLKHYIAQLIADNYCVYVVTGNLPICPADEMHDFCMYESMSTKKHTVDDEDAELATAIQMSLNEAFPRRESANMMSEDNVELQKALEASIADRKRWDEEDDRLLKEAIQQSLASAGPSSRVTLKPEDQPCSSKSMLEEMKTNKKPNSVPIPANPPPSIANSYSATYGQFVEPPSNSNNADKLADENLRVLSETDGYCEPTAPPLSVELDDNKWFDKKNNELFKESNSTFPSQSTTITTYRREEYQTSSSSADNHGSLTESGIEANDIEKLNDLRQKRLKFFENLDK